MATIVSNEAARVSLDALTALLNNGVVEWRTGTQPAGGPDAPATGTLLGTGTLNATAFAAAVDENPGAAATANLITGDPSAGAGGVAGWFRAYKTGGTVAVIDGSITVSGGGGDMIMNTTTIAIADPLNFSSWIIRKPEG